MGVPMCLGDQMVCRHVSLGSDGASPRHVSRGSGVSRESGDVSQCVSGVRWFVPMCLGGEMVCLHMSRASDGVSPCVSGARWCLPMCL